MHSVWKSPKKLHSTLRAKRALFTFWVDKSSSKMPKMANLASFWKSKACGHTVLPDRSILISQILVENAKVEKLNATFWMIFAHCICASLDSYAYNQSKANFRTWLTLFFRNGISRHVKKMSRFTNCIVPFSGSNVVSITWVQWGQNILLLRAIRYGWHNDIIWTCGGSRTNWSGLHSATFHWTTRNSFSCCKNTY